MAKEAPRQEQVLEEMRGNPTKTYKQIACELNVSYDTVKKSAANLIKKGYLKKTANGFVVLKEEPIQKSKAKKEMIQTMIDIFLEDLQKAEDVAEKIRMGELLLKLIIKL